MVGWPKGCITCVSHSRPYSAAGQAASAMHAMVLRQVKALKELHKGSSDPWLMQELRIVMDLTLQAKKVTEQSLGHTCGL